MISRSSVKSSVFILFFSVMELFDSYQGVVSSTVTELALQRHNLLPLNKNAESEYPESQEFQDMLSPCKPESGGYFGSTSGDPATVQYGFELESTLNTDISNALYIIRENLMDSIVSITFPSVCSMRDLSLTDAPTKDIVGVTGFNFGDDYDAVQSCIPQLTIHNDCSIFAGTLSVFGTSLTALSMQQFLETIMQLLPVFPVDGMGSNQTKSSDMISSLKTHGVNRLNISHRYTQLIRLPRNDSGDIPDTPVVPIGTKIGLLLLVLLMAAAVVVLIRYILLFRHQHRMMIYDLQPDKKEPFPGKESSFLSQLWIYVNARPSDETSCVSTHSSLSFVSGLSAGISRHQNSQSIYTKRPSEYSSHSMQYNSHEPDSIYIVEPDDEFCRPVQSYHCGLTEDLDTAIQSSDPLYNRESYNETTEYEFELY